MAVISATSLLSVWDAKQVCIYTGRQPRRWSRRDGISSHGVKGIVSTSSQVVALIDTLTNYVLSADERVHKRLSLYIRINGNDAMSLTQL